MFYRELIFVVISLFSLVADANPVNVSKWKKQSNEPQFQIYKTTLLNETILPFLKICHNPTCCSAKDNVTCAFYFDALTWAQEVKLPAPNTSPIFNRSLNVDITEFCQNTAKILDQMIASGHQASATTQGLSGYSRCLIACGDIESKDILASDSCTTALLLMDLTANYTGTAQKSKHVEIVVLPEAGGSVVKIIPPAKELVPEKPSAEHELPVKPSNANPKAVVSPPKKEPPALSKSNPEPENSEDRSSAKGKEPKTPPIPLLPGNVDTQKIETQKDNPKIIIESNPAADDKNPKSQTVSSTPTSVPGLDQPEIEGDTFEQENQSNEDDDGNDVDQSILLPQQSAREKSHDSKSQLIPDTQPESDFPMSRPAFQDEPGSNFFFYFLFAMFACILAYVLYNNKSKIFALILEGRRSHSGRGGRRKHTAAYRKLDTNLEEAITSTTPSGRTSQIIY